MESSYGAADKKKKGGTLEERQEVLDGSHIIELVENERVFGDFVDHKFGELDRNDDDGLSVKELEPAVADIGSALGLPAQGTSDDSDHIYSEVLNEFAHGKQERVSKGEFKEVLSDILLGMAAGLKRDPIVILRIDGEDLREFINSQSFELEMISIFSQIELPQESAMSLRDCIIKALGKLTVEQGMPPCSDSWVMSKIVEPSLQSCDGLKENRPVSQESFLAEFKNVTQSLAKHLKELPVIVAHSENSFDGSGIRRLLSNQSDLDKTLDAALESLPKDHHGRVSKECLRMALDSVGPSAGLPPLGALPQMDKAISEVIEMAKAEDGKAVEERELKKLLTEILGSLMLRLEGNPISASTDSVVHEPFSSSSTLLQPSSSSS